MADDLNVKQALFVEEYMVDLNATRAAMRAGYSEATAQEQGSRLLSHAMVQEALKERMRQRQARVEVSQDRVVRELARIAFFDPRKLLNGDGSPKPVNELDDDTAAALAGLEIVEQFEGSGQDRVFVGYLKKYKIADKNTALANIMKHLGMMTDKVEVTGKDGGPIESRSDFVVSTLADRIAAMKKKKK